MRKEKALKIAAIALAATMASPYAAMAANYTTIKGTNCTFDKYLVEKQDAEVPNLTCKFTISYGQGLTYDVGGKKMEVYAPNSKNVDNITRTDGMPALIGDNSKATDQNRAYVTFAPGDPTTEESARKAGQTIAFMTKATSDEKFAKHTVTVDFSGVTFKEPGIYRYIIKEQSEARQGVTHDSNARTLDVYVTDKNGTLAVSSYVLHTGADAPAANATMGSQDATKKSDYALPTDVADKSSGFTNQYLTHDLTFRKEVTGNQGSKDKYFKFHVGVGSDASQTVVPGDRFRVIMTNAETAPAANAASVYKAADMATANQATPKDEKTPVEFLTGQQLLSGYDFYLKDGQEIMIQGITDNAKYTVTETPEDYKQNKNITADVASNKTAYADPVTDNLKKDVLTGYTNTRDGIIPTGVTMNLLPFILMAGGVIAGITFVSVSAKKRA